MCSSRERMTITREATNSTDADAIDSFVLKELVSLHIASRTMDVIA